MVGRECGGCLSFSARIETYRVALSTDLCGQHSTRYTDKRGFSAALNAIQSYYQGRANASFVLLPRQLLQLFKYEIKADLRLIIDNVMRHP